MRYPRGQWHWVPGHPLSYVRWLRKFVGEVTVSARTLARACADEDCKAIIVTTGSLPCLPAAVLAGRIAKVPVILLIWDIWRYVEVQPLRRFVAETLEPTVLRQAAAVVVPNEMAAESIKRISGVRPVIIRLPTDDAVFQASMVEESFQSATDGFSIVFTGQIYLSMPEPYKRLLAALRLFRNGGRHATFSWPTEEKGAQGTGTHWPVRLSRVLASVGDLCRATSGGCCCS